MQTTIKSSWAITIGMLLCLPALTFVTASVLKYALGAPGLFNIIEPYLHSWGGNQPPGLNINAVIIFGPITALLINLAYILRFQWDQDPEYITIHLMLFRQKGNASVVLLSGMLLLVLFIYGVMENLNIVL
jgi:hypothetical protein